MKAGIEPADGGRHVAAAGIVEVDHAPSGFLRRNKLHRAEHVFAQIGVPLRVCVVDISIGRDPGGLIIMVNPEFVERDGMQLEEEGCLSVPGFNATVVRPQPPCRRPTAEPALLAT